jgi:hypothetical protein
LEIPNPNFQIRLVLATALKVKDTA